MRARARFSRVLEMCSRLQGYIKFGVWGLRADQADITPNNDMEAEIHIVQMTLNCGVWILAT